MTSSSQSNRMRTFFIVWFGQFISLAGSGMTAFALGLWVLERTGSTTDFALISFFGVLPAVIGLPVAGVLVDRWGGRKAMIVTDIGEGLCVVAVALLLWADQLMLWQIYLLVAIAASFAALRRAAYSTLPAMLLPAKELGRANGLVHGSEAAATIIAPLTAGFLMGSVGLWGVLIIDVVTFSFAIATLVMAVGARGVGRDSQAGSADSVEAPAKQPWTAELTYGWRYIRARQGLMLLLIFFVITNFTVQGLARTLFTPLVLSFSSSEVLGSLLAIGGVGLLVGATVMSIRGGPKRHIDGVLGFTLFQGVFVALAGILPSVVLCGLSIFVVSFCFPIVMGSSQALWQRKVPLDSQGRVFSIRYMIGWSSFPLAYLVGGPLVDKVFEPLLAEGGALASSVGQVLGVGPGRGLAFLYILLGLSTSIVAFIGYRFDRLRLVQDELQDAMAD